MKPNFLSLQFIIYLALGIMIMPNKVSNCAHNNLKVVAKKVIVKPVLAQTSMQDIQNNVLFRY